VPQGRYVKLFMEHKSLANGCSQEVHTFHCDKLLTGGIESKNILTDPTVCQSFAKDDRLHVGRVLRVHGSEKDWPVGRQMQGEK